MRTPGSVFLLSLLLVALPLLTRAADKTVDPASINQQTLNQGVPVNALRDFARVLTLIQQNYVKPVSDKQLIDAAIAGMVASLDPHSAWLDSAQMDDLQTLTDGSFGGLGIEIGSDKGRVLVITPLDDSPASRAGIQPGDELLDINGKSLDGLGLDEVVGLLRGEVGTKVTLTLGRAHQDHPVKLTLTRANVKLQSVKSRLLAPGYGYLRITQFQDNTAADVQTALKKLHQKHPHLHGLVLDLRNNPGGVFEAAVAVADTFINQGLIVYTQGRSADSRVDFDASAGDLIDGAPLVALVNAGTASAAEIVAGALQDQQRAVIVGQRTFGKGSVQSVIPMDNGKALKLTIARYYTPSGRSIQAQGIAPDIDINVASVKLGQDQNDFREADLPHHLTNGQPPQPDQQQALTQLEQQDFNLYQALALLKAMHLTQAPSQGAVE